MNKYCQLRLQNRITQLSSLFHIIMKISYNWLKQLINIDLSLEEICEKLTMSGLEVEHIVETESIKGRKADDAEAQSTNEKVGRY